eukprot:7711778-Alexandrium_andersonii.AAC.1
MRSRPACGRAEGDAAAIVPRRGAQRRPRGTRRGTRRACVRKQARARRGGRAAQHGARTR